MKKYLTWWLALILVLATSAMAVNADTENIDFSSGATVSAACPHCGGSEVNWLPLTQTLVDTWAADYDTANGTHYYLAEDTVTLGNTVAVAKGETMCLHLNGKTLTRGNSARAFAVSGTLNLMDHASNSGLVTCMASNSSGGCVIRVNASTGVFNMRGGALELRVDSEVTAKTMAGNGGCVWVGDSGEFNLYDGVIRDGTAGDGGNVYLCANAQFKMYGGTIKDGKTAVDSYTSEALTNTQHGGNLYVGAGAVFEMYGGTIDRGVSKASGGNIYADASSVVTIKDDGDSSTDAPIISNGKAVVGSSGGGNIQTIGTMTVENATICGGIAQYGGNIYAASYADVTLNADIVDGFAYTRGGNLYISSIYANVTITGGNIADGKCNGDGGNLYANNGYVTITGGVISRGTAARGGNIFNNVGNSKSENYLKIADDGDSATAVPVITGGTATKNDGAGGNIYANGILQLGNCLIKDGFTNDTGKDINMTSKGKLTVDSDFAGECGIAFEVSHMTLEANGEYLDTTRDACNGSFPGKLYLESNNGSAYLFGKSGDTTLYITTAAAVDKSGNFSYYKTNAEMLSAYTSNVSYLQPAAGELILAGGSYVVDLCGRDVDITGSGTVTCFDSANSDFTTNGTAFIDGPELLNTSMASVDGKQYYTSGDNGAYTFHLLDMRLTTMAVRPSKTGIYYQGVWLCDETLAARIDTFGVAVSLLKLPDENFRTSSSTLYTEFAGSEFVAGDERSGVLIQNILETGATNNNSRSRRDIYAAAYIVFDDGSVAVTDDNVAYSLYDAAKIVSEDPITFATSIQAMNDMQSKWDLNWKLDFEVDADVLQLQTVYSGKSAYHGELHDHSASGKNADGKLHPNLWKVGLEQKDMDFAALVDHRQVEHMYADFWDPTVFIGGTEAAAMISDLPEDKNKIHFNMLFAEAEGYVNTVSSFAPFNYSEGYFSYPYNSNAISREQMSELIGLVKENGGMFVHVHPKSSGYIDSEDPLDYWFEDWTGLEVFYGYHGYAPTSTNSGNSTNDNYKLWTDLLALGKRVWATAGCDQHNAPQTTALTTIYAGGRNATAWLDEAKTGNLVCGPVGIRMSVGDTAMGSQTSFEGKRLVLSVGDFHGVAYYADHTYRFDVITDSGVVYSQTFDQDTTTYYGMDCDPNAKFYRVEVYDTTLNARIAIGNPIWNEAFYD